MRSPLPPSMIVTAFAIALGLIATVATDRVDAAQAYGVPCEFDLRMMLERDRT